MLYNSVIQSPLGVVFGVYSNIAIDANTTDDGIIEVSKLTGSGGAIAVNLRRGHTSGTFSPLGNGASPPPVCFNIVYQPLSVVRSPATRRLECKF